MLPGFCHKKRIEMTKKKKGTAHQPFEDMNPAQLVEQGQVYLNAGKARKAVSCFKQAGEKNGFSPMLQTLMFKACLARAGQLHAKDLRIEAESMMKLATNFMPSAEDITGKELQTCIAQAPLAQSIKIYSAWLSVHPPCPVCEIKLADRLVETRQWERMESLPQTCGLKANIERIQKAVSEMDRGEWENALTTLKPVPSQSPFAPLRLFCRGMTAFLANDDTRMQKAFSLIPPGFSLMPVIERMRQPLNVLLTGLEEQDTAILNCLWEEPLKNL
jgi:hypothetical protein